jgi:SAM-dependent methyltransferase
MHLLFALEETQVFNALRAAGNEGKTGAELAEECDLEIGLLEGALDYLTFSDIVLSKTGERYALTEQGREWLGQDATLNITYMMAAYAPQLEQLVPALRRQKRYGRDFVRSGSLLAFASWKGARSTYPWIVQEMRSLGVSVATDLGCGVGGLLVDFCKLDPAFRGVGVDIDHDAVGQARRNVREQGLANRIRIIHGDLARPETFAGEIETTQAFNALGIVHELLRDGEDAVAHMFSRMKELFPGRYFFLGEFSRVPDEGWAQIAPADRMKRLHYQHIMHPMSLQGPLLSRDRWLALLKRVDVTCLKVESFFVDEYVLQL